MAKEKRDTLPPSPLAWRSFVRFKLRDADQAPAPEQASPRSPCTSPSPPSAPDAGRERGADPAAAAANYLGERFSSIAEERARFGNELDRVVAVVEAWAIAILAEAGLPAGQTVGDERYPEPIWYASQIRWRVDELRVLRERDPGRGMVCALYVGELIGEAQAHLSHGRDAARGVRIMDNARDGHAQVHGALEDKEQRWRQQLETFDRHCRAGHAKTEATRLAAAELNVSQTTIYNTRRRLKKK